MTKLMAQFPTEAPTSPKAAKNEELEQLYGAAVKVTLTWWKRERWALTDLLMSGFSLIYEVNKIQRSEVLRKEFKSIETPFYQLG